MKDEELARLRAKYGGASPAMCRTRTSGSVDLLFQGNDRRAKPYEGISTFLDAPMRLDAQAKGEFSGIDIPLIGVRWISASRIGRARDWGRGRCGRSSASGPKHHVHKIVPLAEAGVFDIGDVPFRSRYSLEQSHEDIEPSTTRW